jgi:anti-sigma28 factor (negative regulator of flagellin synthesis)
MFGEKKMAENYLSRKTTPTEIMNTDDANGDSVNTNADLNAQFQQLQNRLDKMSDQMQVMRQKVSRLKKAIGNLRDSDE